MTYGPQRPRRAYVLPEDRDAFILECKAQVREAVARFAVAERHLHDMSARFASEHGELIGDLMLSKDPIASAWIETRNTAYRRVQVYALAILTESLS